MNIRYFKEYSHILQRDMEFKVYGDGGKPVIIIPCQAGRFFEFEDRGMLAFYTPYIESGKVQLFTIDSLDGETLAADGDPRYRIERHEQWIRYVADECTARFRELNGGNQKFTVIGISTGALNASTLFLRFPDRFDGLMGLSGIYTNEPFFHDYHDDLTYINAPLQFLQNMSKDHPYMALYKQSNIILCVGQGAWETDVPLPTTRRMAELFQEKDIPAWVDFWGFDVSHDWDWWLVQVPYFLPTLFKNL